MSTVQIYEPAVGCLTGNCGPDAQEELERFASTLEFLQERSVIVARYNLGYDAAEFARNVAVKAAIKEKGVDCLPIVMADGRLVCEGRYPSRAELSAELRLVDK